MKTRLPPPSPRIALDVSLAIVNIVLLLILFFLATGQLLNPSTPGSTSEMAQTQNLPLDDLPKPVLVIGPAEAWTLDGISVDRGNIAEFLVDMPVLHLVIRRTDPAATLIAAMRDPALAGPELKLVTIKAQDTP